MRHIPLLIKKTVVESEKWRSCRNACRNEWDGEYLLFQSIVGYTDTIII